MECASTSAWTRPSSAIGVAEDGVKEFVAIEDGYRESEHSWLMMLRDLNWLLEMERWGSGRPFPKYMGRPVLSVAGFTRPNVLNCLPKSLQSKAALQQIWMAPTREQAHRAFDRFAATRKAKYPKATERPKKDREALLAFDDFPAEHWVHIRTTNPVESAFAAVRLRTARTRGGVSRNTMLALVFRLGLSAEKRWIKLRGFKFSGGTLVVANEGGVEDGLISRSAVKQALLMHQI